MKIINIKEYKHNELGYDHVICKNCENNTFYISVTEKNKFEYLICKECENMIPVNLKPVWGQKNKIN